MTEPDVNAATMSFLVIIVNIFTALNREEYILCSQVVCGICMELHDHV